jgi:peptidoglycan hydrolase CwlO-like protein
LTNQEQGLENTISALNQEIENSQKKFDDMSNALNSGDPELDQIENQIH